MTTSTARANAKRKANLGVTYQQYQNTAENLLQNILSFDNDGGNILGTNYFDSDYAKKGMVYLSCNAGTLRVLIPDSIKQCVSDIQTGKKVMISVLPHLTKKYRSLIEILWDDNTAAPFFINITSDMCDRTLSDFGKRIKVVTYTRDSKVSELWGEMKKVKSLIYYPYGWSG